MLDDLLRAFLAAILAGVLPGFFWAAVLWRSSGLAERLTFSVALSVVLVPAAALLGARLTGGGVTLAVALVAVSGVFAAGLGAYLWSGPGRDPDGPLLVSPVPAPRPLLRGLLLTAVLLLTLYRGYLGPVLHDWPYLRGGDQYSHAVMANAMLSAGEYESYLVYPPGFSTLAAVISRLSGLGPLEVFPVLAPALLILPALAAYALARLLGGWPCGVAAAFFSGILLAGTFANIAEARYPNLVSAQFLLVLAVAALLRLYHSPSFRPGLLFAVLGSSVVLYHSVASFYLAILLVLVAALFLPYLLLARYRRTALALVLSGSLLGMLSVLYAWNTYNLPRLLGGILGGADPGAGGEAVSIAIGSQEPMSLGHLVATASEPVLWLGLGGALVVLARLLWPRKEPAGRLSRATLLLWGFLLFAGSRTALSGFPQRFERDLGMPLAVFAALAVVLLLRAAWPLLAWRRQPRRAASLTGLASLLVVSVVVVAVVLQAGQNLEAAGEASPDVISPEVAAAGGWLREHNRGGNIISTPSIGPGATNRAALALGGYTGLQSYPERRIQDPRSLPPSGVEPLKASRWVLLHPGGERTREILDRYDIRYVVVAKDYPGVDWRAFAGRPERYQLVFENPTVAVFEPRSALRSAPGSDSRG